MDDPTPLSRWSLADLFPSPESPEALRAFRELDLRLSGMTKLHRLLTAKISMTDFLSLLRKLEQIRILSRRLTAYAELRFYENTQEPAAQSFQAGTDQCMAEAENRLLFITDWWKSLPPKAARRLLKGSGPFRYYLEQLRRYRPHTLSEPEERVVNLKNTTGAHALTNLYQSITNRYRFELEVDGRVRRLPQSELMVYVRSAQPALREAAYRSLYAVYGREGPILGQIYSALVRDWRNENLRLRKFSSSVAARNLANDLPDAVVRLLLEVCQSNASVFREYFSLKARRLGLPRLRRYDLYASMAESAKQYAFGDAWKIVRASLERFDPSVADLAGRVLRERHLDSGVRPGKRDGAFCLSVLPTLTPWVLVNFQRRPYDLSTLAHELGHAIHAQLAARHIVFTYDPGLPLAETASTFAEMLLMDSMLEQESDPAVRRDLLFRQMDDAYATIMRQAFFAMFEAEAHDRIGKGATVDDLCGQYWMNLLRQFGDSVEVGEEFRWEWVLIPHFFETPFYVYAYAFGQLLVLSLYSQYRAEGSAFLPRYKRILSAGGSAAPAKILRQAGIRIDREEFWQGGFDLLSKRINQLAADVI
jgi:oligoendopeptidase F